MAPQESRRDLQFFRPDEIHPIVDRVRAWDMHGKTEVWRDRAANLIQLYALTGIRSGEASRLETRDINLDRHELLVRNPKVKFAQRIIPYDSSAAPIMEELVRDADAEGFIVHPKAAGGHKDPREQRLNRTFSGWQTRLKEPRLNGRALRHTFATTLISNGVPLPVVAELLGHSPRSTATMRYLHVLRDQVRHHVTHLATAFLPPRSDEPHREASDR